MKRTSSAKWQVKYNRWQINVQKDGKRRSFYSSTAGRDGQRECHEKADTWLDDNIINNNVKTEVLFVAWLDELAVATSRSHWSQYDTYWRNWIQSEIGHLKVGILTEQHLQNIILLAFKKGLAKKTLSNIKACLTAFVKYCRKNRATKLMIENLYIPRKAHVGERTILQPEDLKKLFSIGTTTKRGKEVFEPCVFAYRFGVSTGLRPGEIIGLRWSDIDFTKATISINQSINAYNEVTTGKNENALRTFAMTPNVKQILIENKNYLRSVGIISKYVFSQGNTEPIKEKTYYKRWVKYRNNANITTATPYELRHTFISIVKGLPEGLVKTVVGHSVNMDTYGVYGHRVNGEMLRTANLIQEEFDNLEIFEVKSESYGVHDDGCTGTIIYLSFGGDSHDNQIEK